MDKFVRRSLNQKKNSVVEKESVTQQRLKTAEKQKSSQSPEKKKNSQKENQSQISKQRIEKSPVKSAAKKKNPEPQSDSDEGIIQRRTRGAKNKMVVEDSSDVEKPQTQKKFQKSEVSIDIDTQLLNDVDLDDTQKFSVMMSPNRRSSRQVSQNNSPMKKTPAKSPVKVQVPESKKRNFQEITPGASDKKSIFKNRMNSQASNQSLDLKEGISNGVKKLKLETSGVGSHRTLTDQKIGAKPKIGSNVNLTNDKFAKITQKQKVESSQEMDLDQIQELLEEDIPQTQKSAAKKSQKSAAKNQKQDNPGPSDVKSNVLNDLDFVVTGQFQNITRENLIQFIKDKGGNIKSAISGKTNYLIGGYILEDGRETNTSGKYRNAQAKKIPILTEQTFENLIERLAKLKGFQLAPPKIEFMDQDENIVENVQNDEPVASFNNQGLPITEEMWCDKYKPVTPNDLVGNRGSLNALYEWLKDWQDVVVHGNKKPMPKTFSRWQNVPNPNAKSALLSGPPGIGKTSAVRMVCKQLGFEVLEMNASDCRSKLAINSHISTLSGNKSIDYWTVAGQKKQEQNSSNPYIMALGGQNTQKSVIIMDEVDGVGAGDRGGIAALIQIIKDTKTPIICICNDRQSQKIASLANHCYDLKFSRPAFGDISKRIDMICQKEGLQISNQMMRQLIESSGNDMRQIINILQMWKNQHVNFGPAFLKAVSKDEKVMINNFDAAAKLLDCGNPSFDQKYTTFRQKLDLFFIDHEFVPLLVQESYLNCFDENARSMNDIYKMAEASEMMSVGDLCNIQIRQNQNWNLLPNYGVLSSVAPTQIIKGRCNYPGFPQWLGKNSSANKSKRLIRELKQKMGDALNTNKYAIMHEAAPMILQEILTLLKSQDVPGLIEYLDSLNITNEMVKEHLMGLSLNKNFAAMFDKVETKTKTAFTKEYNKTHKEITKGPTKKGGKKVANNTDDAGSRAESEKEDSDESEEEVLLDEEEMMEIAKAKKQEKVQKKADAAMKKIQKRQELQYVQKTESNAGEAKKNGKKGNKKK